MSADGAGLLPSRRREILRQSLSVGIATGAYGISFGALSVASGLTLWQTQVLSLLLFSGGSQFALVGVLGAGGGGSAAVATSTLLGVRNGLYGLRTARFLDAAGPRRLLAAHLTIDESTAVGIAQPEPAGRRLGFWVTGCAVFLGWNLMTFVGALVGAAIGDPRTYGLDAAAAAAFAALLWPRLRAGDAAATAVLAAFVALLSSPVLPAGVPVILSAVAAVGVGLWPRRPGGAGPEPGPEVAT